MRKVVLACVLSLAAAACGGGNAGTASSPTPQTTSTSTTTGPACTPAGAALEITAKDLAFDKTCLAAPVNTAAVLTFRNNDASILHNFVVYDKDPAQAGAQKLFESETFTGVATKTLNIPAQAAGTYVFRCDVHPTTMLGSYVVA